MHKKGKAKQEHFRCAPRDFAPPPLNAPASAQNLALISHRSPQEERAAALGQLDRHTAQKLALRREMERVQERMTLKHKNTSRWVKHASGRDDPRPPLGSTRRPTRAAVAPMQQNAPASAAGDLATPQNPPTACVRLL